MYNNFMTKKRLLLIIGGIVLVAGGLILVINSVTKLPPQSVKPNAKPAVAAAPDRSLMVVNASSPQQTVSIASQKSTSSKPTASACSQTASSSVLSASPSASGQSATSVLSSVIKNITPASNNSDKKTSGSQLPSALLNIAGGLD